MNNIGTQWTGDQILALTWQDLAPYYRELNNVDLTPDTLEAWLDAWSNLLKIERELEHRRYIAPTRNTADAAATQAFEAFLNEIQVQYRTANQTLTEKLLQSQLEPAGFHLTLHQLRTQAALFNKQNLALLNEQALLAAEYDRITGSQTVEWDGSEKTVAELQPYYLAADRGVREAAWRLSFERQFADREALNHLWARLIDRRHRIAVNTGLPTFRDYRWLELTRFAYSPEDCLRFHEAIQAVVVPAVSRLLAEHQQRLGVERLRPWDLLVESLTDQPLRPYDHPDQLDEGIRRILGQVDPDFADYYQHMRENDLLDIHNRNNKATGGYSLDFPMTKDVFVFLNCVGLHSDVQGVLHESGHAVHFYETANSTYARYAQQIDSPMEFAEVAAMSMELLTMPYWGKDQGGFYDPRSHRIAEIQALRSILTFLPFMSVVDLFQHWAYTHPESARIGANCDHKWSELWDRFLPDADWSGFEDIKATGWQRKIHIYSDPFYYVEYGLAQLGALQVWQNARRDHDRAVAAYRSSLERGGSEDLRTLYRLADTEMIFDREPLQGLIDDVMARITELTASL
ncbi:MAG: M3 family oligoendopeptidase [Anaerolineae bacterium]|nr:M3 family oligoendopeptidase [Anaerolineae bacterium]